ncbi:hypothetical protein LQ327_00820 [Actinomycetospora endophytica]|uniref:Uncharacterized protein n=1 Tax=Actinomycetospora endophytica TaxID=2291215 RepID=A0ABS8P117_9PSEU|nr:hypothetical protein [Actinomycetospora endophytica]MCD2191931.1 hypothetical protein [Actinomycetospora endophytica]
MGLFDRLTGTRRPQAGVPALPAGQLHDAIVALDCDDVPWSIRSGAQEGADLVAVWETTEPASFLYMIVMRFDEARHEVSALDRLWQSKGPSGGAQYGQGGNVSQRGFSATIERDANGKLRMVKTGEFDTRELKNPIRDTVTASGWTWRTRAL